MAYTTDYYHILGLETPSWVSRRNISTAEMRRAYKVALLAAHPDKKSNMDGKQMRIAGEKGGGYTIDEVKAAYMILSEEKSKADYDKWLLLPSASTLPPPSLAQQQAQNPSSDFVLGLEIMDLGDFHVFEYPAMAITTTATATMANNNTSPSSSTSTANSSDDSGDDGSMRMEWTRGCRCGADKGFRIREEELEDAERKGDREVLVGCEGCSLWVRVGFDVEEEEEEEEGGGGGGGRGG